MTVKDLIAQLQLIENKDAIIIVDNMVVNYVVCDKKQDAEDVVAFQYIWFYD